MYAYEHNRLRELASELDHVAGFCNSTDASASANSALLLIGAAGTGKTHLFCDVAVRRISNKQPTLLFRGSDFEEKEPLTQIAGGIVGLRMNRDDFLAAADAAGEASDGKFLILIDAINEGEGYLLWDKYMPGMLHALLKYPRVAVALSVRDTYIDLVVPQGLDDRITKARHFGFAGHEYSATKTFFEFYKLKAPSIPLLNPEFDNPQFLKLFCTTLANLGQTEVPRGLPGLTQVFNGFLDSVNQKLSSPKLLDYDKKDKLVHRAVEKLVQRMASKRASSIAREEARKIVNELLPVTKESSSLFRHLLNEGVIFENRAYSAETNNSVEVVEFAFERFADHLVAQHMLSEYADSTTLAAAFSEGGGLSILVRNEPARIRKRGVIDALSVQVPEKFGRELAALVPPLAEASIGVEAFLNSLTWREPRAFTDETITTVNQMLREFVGVEEGLFRQLLLLAATPAHPWNAEFLHRSLARRNFLQRDSTWSIFVFNEFGEHGPVDRLIEWGWSDENKQHIDDDSLELAATALTWFLTTSNRHARDQATKAIVSLLSERLHVFAKLINRFKSIDDLYLLERLFAAAYGCAMRSRDKSGLSRLAETTFKVVFSSGKAIPHILLRDYARGVIEFARHNGCKLTFNIRRARPPYKSEWIEPTFKEGELEGWEKWSEGMPEEEWARVHIHHSVMGQEDFARYIIGTNSGSFEWTPRRRSRRKRARKPGWSNDLNGERFELGVAQRWIMRRVIDMGWSTALFGKFDRRVMHGNYDRSPHKGERIGKKYQWIAYHEFLARVSDNFEFIGDTWARKNEAYDGPWQVGFIRDIDPSCLIARTSTDTHALSWWQPTGYDPGDSEMSDQEWVQNPNDLPDAKRSIEVTDHQGIRYLALQSYFSFDQGRDDAEYSVPRRQLWYQIRSYIVRKRNLRRLLEWAKSQHFTGRWMPESHAAYTLFLGEFFWSSAYRYLQQPYYEREKAWSSRAGHGSHKLPAPVALTTDEYSHERGYDCSIEDTVNLMLPSEMLFRGLKLRWNTRAGEYIDPIGQLAVQHPSAYTPGPPAITAREETLLSFLSDNDLGIVWTVLGEKNVLTHDRDNWPGRLEISGAYTLEGGTLAGDTHHKVVGRKGGPASP